MERDPLDFEQETLAQAERDDREKLAERVAADDIRWLMSGKRGRRIVRKLLAKMGVWQSSFSTDALAMAFNEGRRNEGLALLASITEHCPDRYSEMIKET